MAILVTATSLIAAPAEDKRFSAVIKPDPATQTTSVRVRIPKAAHAEPVQSVYLQRASKTGLDLHVPVNFSERPDGVSIFLILPTGWTERATLRVAHRVPDTGVLSSAVSDGETYEIPLIPSAEPKK
ncbi:hypothetical protein OKA05_14225 [Luteolibacter arcticus]|uniref:Uncharacterized protein n=1 Tax=Luteolibacter arcticus TaxID=1581411 RepID=A0ABT3GJM1_9BACT|nr:hypothetical protein [Luteolibacter arcticus]MCW1923719.1 hypothetical protein [Luteolibacter arcticus]